MGQSALDAKVREALLEVFDNEELLELARRLIAIESHHLAPGQKTPVNGQEICRYVDPVLTSVRVPGYDLDVTAGTELLKKLE